MFRIEVPGSTPAPEPVFSFSFTGVESKPQLTNLPSTDLDYPPAIESSEKGYFCKPELFRYSDFIKPFKIEDLIGKLVQLSWDADCSLTSGGGHVGPHYKTCCVGGIRELAGQKFICVREASQHTDQKDVYRLYANEMINLRAIVGITHL